MSGTRVGGEPRELGAWFLALAFVALLILAAAPVVERVHAADAARASLEAGTS
jgi:hypothetical protein